MAIFVCHLRYIWMTDCKPHIIEPTQCSTIEVFFKSTYRIYPKCWDTLDIGTPKIIYEINFDVHYKCWDTVGIFYAMMQKKSWLP